MARIQDIMKLPIFNAQDGYDVQKFVEDFERKASLYGWTMQQQFLIAKMRLGGTAALWLRAELVERASFADWQGFKRALLSEFCEGVFVMNECEDLPGKHENDDHDDKLKNRKEDCDVCDNNDKPIAQVASFNKPTEEVETIKEEKLAFDIEVCHVQENTEIPVDCENYDVNEIPVYQQICNDVINKSVHDEQWRIHIIHVNGQTCDGASSSATQLKRRRDTSITIREENDGGQAVLARTAHHNYNFFTRDNTRGSDEKTLVGVCYDVFLYVFKFRFYLYGVLMSS